jgi:predicted nucleic acid-binding protein
VSRAAETLAIQRPDIVVPDAGPLIHLSQAGALGLLHEIGGTVVIVDMVRQELTDDPAKPEARQLQDWIEAGLKPGSNCPVRLAETETGEAFRLARLVRPDFRMRDGGETAIVQWLAQTVEATQNQTIVLYENGKVPKVVRREALDADIDVMTTRAFIELAARHGLIASADVLWRRIIAAAPTTNPDIEVYSHRRPKGDAL